MHGTENILKGQWQQIRGQVKTWWGELTDDEITQIAGNRDVLAGKLRERYGWTQERTESEIDRFLEDTAETMPASPYRG